MQRNRSVEVRRVHKQSQWCKFPLIPTVRKSVNTVFYVAITEEIFGCAPQENTLNGCAEPFVGPPDPRQGRGAASRAKISGVSRSRGNLYRE
jgi:hypothetical protein